MGQWLNHQILLLDFGLQSTPRSPFYSLRFPSCLGITSHEDVHRVTRDWNAGWELRAPAVPSPARDCTWVKEGRWQGLGSTRPRAPPRSRVLGRKSRREGQPRPCLGYTGSTAVSTPPAPLARLGSPAGRTPLPLHATETPRPQVPSGREVLHHLLDLTSAKTVPPRFSRDGGPPKA